MNARAPSSIKPLWLKTKQGKWIRNYWENERKFSLETAKDFQIGIAPRKGNQLLELLRKKEFSPGSDCPVRPFLYR